MRDGQKDRERAVVRISLVTMLGNGLLSGGKLAAGLAYHSQGLISDAVHSLSDVFSTLVVIAGVKLAGRRADATHPYGHERLECVASILLAVVLGLTGAGIGLNGLRQLVTGSYSVSSQLGAAAFWAAGISVVGKELMFWYARAGAKRLHSGALMADAWHHRTDALSSLGSLAGLAGVQLGYPMLDAVACVVICLLIEKAAVDIFRDAAGRMTDHAAGEDVVAEIRSAAAAQEGVLALDDIKTRLFASRVYVDLEIAVDAGLSVAEGHAIAHRVHDAVESTDGLVKHCTVHVNPAQVPAEEKPDRKKI